MAGSGYLYLRVVVSGWEWLGVVVSGWEWLGVDIVRLRVVGMNKSACE